MVDAVPEVLALVDWVEMDAVLLIVLEEVTN